MEERGREDEGMRRASCFFSGVVFKVVFVDGGKIDSFLFVLPSLRFSLSLSLCSQMSSIH